MNYSSISILISSKNPAEVKLVRYFDEGKHMYLVFELCEGGLQLIQRIWRSGAIDVLGLLYHWRQNITFHEFHDDNHESDDS